MTLLGFFLTLAVHPWLIGGFVTGRWLVLFFAVPLLIAYNGQRPQLGWAWSIVLGWGALTLLWAPDTALAFNRWLDLAVLWCMWNLGQSDKLARGMCWGLSINAAICLLQLADWWPVPLVNSPSGLYLNRNMMAELAAPLAVWAVSQRQRIAAWPLMCLVLSADRAAVVAAGVIVWAWKRWRWLVVALVVIGFAGLTYFKGLKDFTAREDIWLAAWRDMTWYGVGMGAFQVNHRYFEFIHCDPMEFIYELGWAALPLGWLVWRGLRGGGAMATKLALCALLVESLFSFPFQLPTTAVLGASLLGDLCHIRNSIRIPEPDDGNENLGCNDRRSARLAARSA